MMLLRAIFFLTLLAFAAGPKYLAAHQLPDAAASAVTDGPPERVAADPNIAAQLKAEGVESERQKLAVEAAVRKAQLVENPYSLQGILNWIILHGFNLALIVAGAYGALSLGTFLAQKFVRSMTRAGEGETEEDLAIRAEVLVGYLRPVITTLVVVTAGLMILDELAVPIGPLLALASAVLAMIAIGFIAVWSVLSNALCSVILLIYQPFSVGSIVELTGAEVSGKVVNFNMLFTTLRTDDGDLIEVPNNLFFQQPILRRLGGAETSLDKQLLEPDTKA